MRLDDELEFGLQFLRDDGYHVGDPQVSGNTIRYPVDGDLWPEDKIRELARQAAEAELERNRGEVLAQQLAAHVAGLGASGATQKVVVKGKTWIVSVAMEGTQAPSSVDDKTPQQSGRTRSRKDKRA